MTLPSLLRVVALAVLVPATAHSQVGFETLFKDITDVNFFVSCWATKGPLDRQNCPSQNSGYGIEVSYDLGKIKLGRGSRSVPASWKDSIAVRRCTQGTCDSCEADCELSVTSVKRPGREEPHWYLRAEFALSYSQFSGFVSQDTSFDLRGTVREIPGVALYGTLHADSTQWLSAFLDFLAPYVSLKSGLIELNNTQIHDHRPAVDSANTVWTGNAKAFQIGWGGGLVLSPSDRLHFFIEWTRYYARRFGNVQWTGATNIVPAKFPTSLDFNGRTFSAGLQFSIRGF